MQRCPKDKGKTDGDGNMKELTLEERDKIADAVDRIAFNSYLVWFGIPLREPEKINEELRKAKKELEEVCK